MRSTLKKDNAIETSLFLLYLIFFVSLAFSLRAVSSISIALLLVTGLIKHKDSLFTVLKRNKTIFLFAACALLFLLQLLSLFSSNNTSGAWKDISLKSSLVAIPLAISLSATFKRKTWIKLITGYCLIICAAALYCLIISSFDYLRNNDPSVFFYHELTRPINQHAVYFSICIFISLILVLESLRKKDNNFPASAQIAVVIFLSIFLVLLSSKLVIVFYILYLAWYFITQAKVVFKRKIILGLSTLLLIMLGIILITRNPVADRFRDMITGDITLAQQDQFTPGDYFNGLQFRLLQWKLVPSILNDNNAWLTGVGPTKAQPLLDKQYISRNMYTGDPSSGQRGYPGFNTHNQLLESLLKNGIPGAIAFLLILLAMLKLSWQKRHSSHFFVFLLLSAYACVESVFETQYGIVLFVFFPFFLCMEE